MLRLYLGIIYDATGREYSESDWTAERLFGDELFERSFET